MGTLPPHNSTLQVVEDAFHFSSTNRYIRSMLVTFPNVRDGDGHHLNVPNEYERKLKDGSTVIHHGPHFG